MLITKKFLLFFFVSLAMILAVTFGYKKIKADNLNKNHVIEVRILKDKWQFSPEEITVSAHTAWELRIYNEDNYSHGFFIESLEINQDLPPEKETIVKIPPSTPGVYSFYCSVVCGSGHYRMSGKLNIVERLK